MNDLFATRDILTDPRHCEKMIRAGLYKNKPDAKDKTMPKLSFTTMATPDWDGPEAIRAARRYGYAGVDLRVSEHKGELTLDSSEQELGELRAVLDGEGICLSCLLGYNTGGYQDAASWAAVQESIRAHLSVAERLGAESVRIFSGAIQGFPDRTDYLKQMAEAIAGALNNDDSNVVLVMQNHRIHTSLSETLTIVQLVNHPRLRIAACPVHLVAMDEYSDTLLSAAKPYVGKLFIGDEKLTDTEQKKYTTVLPGQGDLPLADFYEKMGGNSFSGWVTFKWECLWNPKLAGPEVALPHFIAFAKSL